MDDPTRILSVPYCAYMASVYHFSHCISTCVYIRLHRIVTICGQRFLLFCLYILISSSQMHLNVALRQKRTVVHSLKYRLFNCMKVV